MEIFKPTMVSVFLVSVLLLDSAVYVVGQQPGFLSIDCGLDDKYSGYNDPDTGIYYVSDGPYIDAGENQKMSPEYESRWQGFRATVRSFPSGERNCYMLPAETGAKYLVRLEAVYGNHDGKNDSSSKDFDVYLGTNYWATVYVLETGGVYEALFIAQASWAPVCLLNTGHGVPFLSLLEFRKLPAALYPSLTANQAMYMLARINMGGTTWPNRFPVDRYDRFWWLMTTGSQVANRSTSQRVQPDPDYDIPQAILQTAVELTGNETQTTITYSASWQGSSNSYKVFLHFADFQSTEAREFDIYFNGNRLNEGPYSPPYLGASCVSNPEWFKGTGGVYNITLAATTTSVLRPMLNAIEIYSLISFDNPTTFNKDFDAIMTIKLEYGVKKNWMGDPCFPSKYTWHGVKCSNTSDNTIRITSLDLSSSSLRGTISTNFTLLTALENLDLSYNNLSGSIPDSLTSLSSLRVLSLSGNNISSISLCKNNTGPLTIRYESDETNLCNTPPDPSKAPTLTKGAIVAISVVFPVLVMVILLGYFIWRQKRKPNVSTYPERDPQVVTAPGGRKRPTDHLPVPNSENGRFTYKELEKYTHNFERSIGQGGFGPVYHGSLEDNTEVAVKIRSESSSHGLDQFLAEVESLTKVHHRNIVSLIGYCWEKAHLALVYEYMSQGSLFDHLRGKNYVTETLNWGRRVRVVLEAAQGLDYLHKGCSPPIIHRDVKSSNILLGQNFQAKIADMGLSKMYLSDAQTHMSLVTTAGTTGYMDPQYALTGRLTESSDVYSFGVVLLEVATGEPPIVPGHGHIVHRVRQMIATGDISSVADVRLGGAYDITSMWKLVDTAMLCTAESAAQRPTMAAVVAQLKESLALEETRENNASSTGTQGSEIPPITSTSRPMAR